MSLSPPPPFPDFDFNFDPAVLSTHPLPLPSSADLFSADETTDLLGFLDNFNDFGWEQEQQQPYLSQSAPYSNPHLNTAPEPSTSGRPRRASNRSSCAREKQQLRRPELSPRRSSATPSNASESSSEQASLSHSASSHTATSTTSTSTSAPPPAPAPASAPSTTIRTKPLLSTPQKRLNHIMSEQKRRNAIRDGYAQLISLIAPTGSAPGSVIGMPQRGRPKGSGSRGGKGAAGQNTAKGKSGVLFRAVEYIQWLEEGRDAMRAEVLRVEAAAGIRL